MWLAGANVCKQRVAEHLTHSVCINNTIPRSQQELHPTASIGLLALQEVIEVGLGSACFNEGRLDVQNRKAFVAYVGRPY